MAADDILSVLTTEGSAPSALATTPPLRRGGSRAPDKLQIINNALIATGNNPCAVADDNSPEWLVGSMAFERWVPVLLRRRNWPFATTFADLSRIDDSRFPGFSDVYAKPLNCLFLQDVYRSDLARAVIPSLGYAMPQQDTRPPPLEYRIVSDLIHCVAPEGATAIYIAFPEGAQSWSTGFVEALTLKIEAMIYRGLNEDSREGARCDRDAELAMEEEASRATAEAPRRMAYRSSVVEARRRRGGGGGAYRLGSSSTSQPAPAALPAAPGTSVPPIVSDFGDDFGSDFG